VDSGVFTFSEAGAGHAENEDAFDVRRHPADERRWLCTLADGQGGRAGGSRAARLACSVAMQEAMTLAPHKLAEPAAWASILRRADEAVAADPEAGLTTLVGLSVAGRKVCGASNGDSAVLAWDSVGRAEELTRHQFKNPPVGSGFAAVVPFGDELVSPWAVLAISDGVWKYVGWQGVIEAVRRARGEALLESLQEMARLRGTRRFPDDFTVVVLQDQS
jgi:serine/threonine protein phosphatase PrpC